MKKINVLILATGYPRWDGDFVNIYLHRLARSLVNKGVETHVIAPHAAGLKKEEEIDGVKIHRFQYFWPSNLQSLAYFPGMPEKIKTLKGKTQLFPFMFSMIKKTIDVVKKYKIDVINAHWAIPPGFMATFAKMIHGKPVLITLYGAELWPCIKKGSSFMKWLISYAIIKANKVIAISDATRDAGIRISGWKDIEILPDGIDINIFNPEVSGDYVSEKYGINNCFLIFSSGRMVERKGFRYLIEAMPYILEIYPSTKLIIGGDGPERRFIENLAKMLKVDKNVIFTGFIPNIDFPKYMKACDVFVLPSIVDSSGDTEGSATILLEAMSCGTPVVGTRVGGIPYSIKDGIGGFLVEQKNAEELSKSIIILLEDTNLRKDLSVNGRKYVEENFNLSKIAEKYISIFKSLT